MNQTKQPLPLVLVTHTLPEGWLGCIEDRCRMIVGPVDATQLSPDLEAHLGEAEGLFTLLTIRVDDALLEKAPHLRVVSNMAVGVDNIDLAACTRRGIPVGNTPGVLTEGTADLTMALMLAVARRLPESSLDAREGRWKTWSPTGWLGTDLHGATLGIIGMGKIGRAVAHRAWAFGMRVIYSGSRLPRNTEESMAVHHATMDELLHESDFVSLHVPLTRKTQGLIGEPQLFAMKQSAILINTARGPVVDTNALVRALKEGWIAAAGLDVTDPEPLPPEHPLYSLPNCLITPHIGSATHNTRRWMAELACNNLVSGLEGRRLPHCVNPEVYSQKDRLKAD